VAANRKMVHVADVEGNDALSGVDQVMVTGTSNEPGDDDILIVGGSVDLRAERDAEEWAGSTPSKRP